LSDDLDERLAWPDELRYLLERHPRATWTSSRSPSVAFWLEVHTHFRYDCAALEDAHADLRGGRLAAPRFAVAAGQRLRSLVGGLHGHHQIEDHQYFPAFRLREPRLAAGFDTLARDHERLHGDIAAALGALRDLNAAAQAPNAATVDLAARRFADAASRLCRRLRRHLDDEEDLVVPLLLVHDDH
jgi:hypothetical protein